MRSDSRELDTDQDEAEGSGDELKVVLEVLTFVLRSPRRHPKVAMAVLLLVSALGIVASALAPRIYLADVQILARQGLNMGLGKNPQQDDSDRSDPARPFTEMTMRRDNLLQLVKGAHLLENAGRDQQPIERLKGVLLGWATPAKTDEDKEAGMVAALQQKLTLGVDGNTVTFWVEWSNPDTALDLVTLVEKNFFDNRNAAEVGIMSDAIALLESRAAEERKAVDDAMAEVQTLKDAKLSAAAATAAAAASAATAVASGPPGAVRFLAHATGPDPEVTKRIDQVEKQIRDTEDARQRQLFDLKTQLSTMEATFTPSHPSVVALRKNIEALSVEPASLTALRNEDKALLAEVARANGEKAAEKARAGAAGGPALPSTTGTARDPLNGAPMQFADPQAAAALTNLQNSVRKYQDYLDRLDGAKLDLQAAQAAFKYRYAEFRPPRASYVPRRSPLTFVKVGVGLALVLAFLVPALIDFLGGRFIESWQVHRSLGLPVLGEIDRL